MVNDIIKYMIMYDHNMVSINIIFEGNKDEGNIIDYE